MKKVRLSIGSWAYCFGPYQTNPVPFKTVVQELAKMGYDGVEFGAFNPHPGPNDCDTKVKRQELRKFVADHGLAFSGLAADLWGFPIIPNRDNYAWMNAFEKNLQFAWDFGIDVIRVDSVSPPDVFAKNKIEYALGYDRLVSTFKTAAKKAADWGMRVIWEFEPGFAMNKPSEILNVLRDVDEKNFSALYDTCHAHMVAAVGALQPGEKELLPGGALELLKKLKGKIGHVHLIDSDGSLNEHNTSTHNPFGTGKLNFDQLVPELLQCGAPTNWWCVDLCFWPDAWNVTADSKKFLDAYIKKYAA